MSPRPVSRGSSTRSVSAPPASRPGSRRSGRTRLRPGRSERMDVTRDQVKDYLKNMSLMDAAQLVKELESELGVSAAAPMAIAGGGAAAAPAAAAAPEKEEFTVVLTGAGDKKIQVIKVV